MVGVTIVAATLWVGAPPAMAHEFKVVVVESDTETAADARRGFRLAVDQSPDVSHTPDEEAGDHLGGVDVDIVSGQVASPSVAGEVSSLLDSGASAVVVLAGGSGADAAIASARARNKLVLAIGATASPTATPGHIVLRAGSPSDQRRFAAFVEAFAETTGSDPTEAAALGYDAGMLLDALVSGLGEDLTPGRDLAAAVNAASDQLVLAKLDVVPDVAPAAVAADEPPPGTGRRRTALIASAGGLVVVAAGTAWVAMRRIRRGS